MVKDMESGLGISQQSPGQPQDKPEDSLFCTSSFMYWTYNPVDDLDYCV